MVYNGSYITSFSNKEPLDKDETKKAITVFLVSLLIFISSVICKCLLLAIPSGIVLYICAWLFFGNLFSIRKKKQDDKELARIKERYGEEWYKNPEYKI